MNCSPRLICTAITRVGASQSLAPFCEQLQLQARRSAARSNSCPKMFSFILLLSCILFEVFSENKKRNRRTTYTCVYMHEKCAMPISVRQKENELTTKGSDRILVSKSPLNIVDPERATWHAAKTLGAIVALHISVIWLSHKLHSYSKYSLQRLRRHYLKG